MVAAKMHLHRQASVLCSAALPATHPSTIAFSLLGSAPRISSTFSPLK